MIEQVLAEYTLLAKASVWMVAWNLIGFQLKKFFALLNSDNVVDEGVKQQLGNALKSPSEDWRLVNGFFTWFFGNRLITQRAFLQILWLTVISFFGCFYLLMPSIIDTASQWQGLWQALGWGVLFQFLLRYLLTFQVRWIMQMPGIGIFKFLLSIVLSYVWLLLILVLVILLAGFSLQTVFMDEILVAAQGHGSPVRVTLVRTILIITAVPSLWILLQAFVHQILCIISRLRIHRLFNKEQPLLVLGWVLWGCSLLLGVLTLPFFILWS